jgi:hypothetical protein
MDYTAPKPKTVERVQQEHLNEVSYYSVASN